METHPNLLPQQELRRLGLEAFLQTHPVNARLSEDGRLVTLKYDQIDSPDTAVTRQCRGLILEVGSWDVVARPFDRFFNAGEGRAATLQGKLTVAEKLDGSLLIFYHYNGRWQVATSGMPTAGGPFRDGLLFRDRIAQVMTELGMDMPSQGLEDYTLMAELCLVDNPIVCRHKRNRIVLLGARNRQTGVEVSTTDPVLAALPWERVREYPLNTLDEVLETFKDIDPLEQEGYILRDEGFRRVKVKHPGYVALHHLKGNGVMTVDRALTVILTGELAEVSNTFPEYQPILQEIEGWVQRIEEVCNRAWGVLQGEGLTGTGDRTEVGSARRKQFALRVKGMGEGEGLDCAILRMGSGYLFSVLTGRYATLSQAIREDEGKLGKLIESLRKDYRLNA